MKFGRALHNTTYFQLSFCLFIVWIVHSHRAALLTNERKGLSKCMLLQLTTNDKNFDGKQVEQVERMKQRESISTQTIPIFCTH